MPPGDAGNGSSRFYFNGIDADTGGYLRPPQSAASLVDTVAGETQDGGTLGRLAGLRNRYEKPGLDLPYGVDPTRIDQAGWGLVVPAKEKKVYQDALGVLVKHRAGQAPPDRFKILTYKPRQKWREWLAEHEVPTGVTEPEKVPYYLLLVGEPGGLPFEFQHMLNLDYAVGRLSFTSLDEYRQYAESVVACETASQPLTQRTAAFFGTRHDGDPATQLSAGQLIQPLASGAAGATTGVAEQMGYTSRLLLAEQADKASLHELFHSPADQKPPALLFGAAHGVVYRRGHPDQLLRQGGLICQDFAFGHSLSPQQCFFAEDLTDQARLHGMIAFLFACFAAGTPLNDEINVIESQPAHQLADHPFVARLPQRMLAHPAGGALAVIGHIDVATSYSIQPAGLQAQLQPFANTLKRLMNGEPAGHALLSFRQRFANLGSELADLLREKSAGARIDPAELAIRWIERNDARNYILLGDPAVRLRA